LKEDHSSEFIPGSTGRLNALAPVSVSERDLNQRQNVGIVLLRAFKLEEVEVSASVGGRKFSAHSRSGVVYLALAGYRIQKSAGLSQNRVCLAT
jgi:hypothetical protein